MKKSKRGHPERSGLTGWRRGMDPTERLKQDVGRYTDAVIYALGCQWRALADVRDARAVTIPDINKILRRSSADALTPLVLAKMSESGLIRIDGTMIHFLPDLITAFERGGEGA